jgi:murein DD-endopeptidase MepM/ murein hydrolase activator NlpD
MFSRLFVFWTACLSVSAGLAADFTLHLPTANEALLKKDGEGYFQFVDRNFEGEKTTPWEGGQFGFWRDPRRVGTLVAYARFHEGMDVKPVQRDAAGEPQDAVLAILPGEVAYISAARSNYGRYVVMKHDWGEGPFYSLYAHLSEVHVTQGQSLQAGEKLARMGYTGAGIDKRRAHLHVELNIMLDGDFQKWHDSGFGTPNQHGPYNGMNLLGLNLQALYLAQAEGQVRSVANWLQTQQQPVFEVSVPTTARMEIATRYPWLTGGVRLDPQAARSYRIRCTRWGLPLGILASDQPCASPQITWVAESQIPKYYLTRGLVTNSGVLSREGLRFIQLLTSMPVAGKADPTAKADKAETP